MHFSSLALSVLLFSHHALCDGGNYWWMNQQEVFSGNGAGAGAPGGCGGGGCGGHSGQSFSSGPSGFPSASNGVQTECPAGTKCVGDYFCDENAIMVNYRVNLTPAQRRKRGDLIPCMNQQTGSFDVCCSTVANPLPIGNNNINTINNNNPPRNNFQQTPTGGSSFSNTNVVANRPQGACPSVGNLPSLARCNGAESNCWSVGEPDVDCPNNALCCFDGCRNTCYNTGIGGRPSAPVGPINNVPGPAPGPRPDPIPQQPGSDLAFETIETVETINTPPASPEIDPEPFPGPPLRVPSQPVESTSSILPASQFSNTQQTGIVITDGGCPSVTPFGGDQCSGEKDTCWNVGGQDDCQSGFLCCYDGCTKTCYDTANQKFLRLPGSRLEDIDPGGRPTVTAVSDHCFHTCPSVRPRISKQISGSSSFISNTQTTSISQGPAQPLPSRPSTTFTQNTNTQTFSQSSPVNNRRQPVNNNRRNFNTNRFPSNNNNNFPQNVNTNRRTQTVTRTQTVHSSGPSKSYPQNPRNPGQGQVNYQNTQTHSTSGVVHTNVGSRPVPNRPVRRPVNTNFGQTTNTFQQTGNNNFQPADTKPFVKCPSAMLCIPRQNCDYEGFITDKIIRSDPVRDMLRVPLIDCINPDTQDINVCCRDPNYVDPWPQNGGGGGGGHNHGGQGFRGNQGHRGGGQAHGSKNYRK